jgi:hypothetical protein
MEITIFAVSELLCDGAKLRYRPKVEILVPSRRPQYVRKKITFSATMCFIVERQALDDEQIRGGRHFKYFSP